MYVITNVQNICNLVGWEEYTIGRTVPSTSILYSLTKSNNIQIPRREKIEIY